MDRAIGVWNAEQRAGVVNKNIKIKLNLEDPGNFPGFFILRSEGIPAFIDILPLSVFMERGPGGEVLPCTVFNTKKRAANWQPLNYIANISHLLIQNLQAHLNYVGDVRPRESIIDVSDHLDDAVLISPGIGTALPWWLVRSEPGSLVNLCPSVP